MTLAQDEIEYLDDIFSKFQQKFQHFEGLQFSFGPNRDIRGDVIERLNEKGILRILRGADHHSSFCGIYIFILPFSPEVEQIRVFSLLKG